MQALIDFIIRNLLALWPIAQVDEWKAAMMVRNGRIQRTLGPGLHWRWWFVDRKVEYPGSEVMLSLATTSVTTADGKALAIDANLGYRLVDIALSWRTMWNLETSIKALAAGIACSTLAVRTWSDLQGANRQERELEILASLNEATMGFGIAIVRVHLVACVEAKQHRHFVDGALASGSK